MSDFKHLATNTQSAVDTFIGGSQTAGASWQNWQKPIGKTMAQITCVGQGGGGGAGVIGANSVSAGGGGGAGGNLMKLTIPLCFLPDQLYISCGESASGAGIASYVSIRPNTTPNFLLCISNGGTVGGAASAGTGGIAGAIPSINAIANCCIAGLGNYIFLAGGAGIAGGAAIAGAALTLPTTGLFTTGGTGGGGLPAAAATGTNGGSFTVPAAPSPFPAHLGGVGSATATDPADEGRSGFNNVLTGLLYNYGGTGGASTHGTATGGGLVQARGGNGGYGCGGGGQGGALTGSSVAVASKGGAGFVIIVCW